MSYLIDELCRLISVYENCSYLPAKKLLKDIVYLYLEAIEKEFDADEFNY